MSNEEIVYMMSSVLSAEDTDDDVEDFDSNDDLADPICTCSEEESLIDNNFLNSIKLVMDAISASLNISGIMA